MKFKPDKKYEKKEKEYQKEGNRAYLKHEEKEVAVTKKHLDGKKKDGKKKDGKKDGMKSMEGCK